MFTLVSYSSKKPLGSSEVSLHLRLGIVCRVRRAPSHRPYQHNLHISHIKQEECIKAQTLHKFWNIYIVSVSNTHLFHQSNINLNLYMEMETERKRGWIVYIIFKYGF